ncbi:MAG: Brp/Blh family beta-carotene 15,15'-dioxygenase [Ekhidna sp.]|nr:Brp/Blh family beta-carotene 15,15'-dioxygenase [Ekhidna sp.]
MFIFQLAVLFVLIIIGLFSEPERGSILDLICIILILVFGVPHGALDHKIHLTVNQNTSLKAFLFKYLLVGGFYAIWWILHPKSAIWFFILISSYHFGQETFESYNLKAGWVGRFLTGGFLVIGSLLFHYEETIQFITTIGSGIIPFIQTDTSIFIALLLTLINLTFLAILFFKTSEKEKYIKLILFCALYVLININYSLLVSFTIYFIFFHSLNAFKHQYEWLKKQYSSYNIRKFFANLSGFSLLAIIGIVLILLLFNLESMPKMITYFFMLISIITLPHVITFDEFYRKRSDVNQNY